MTYGLVSPPAVLSAMSLLVRPVGHRPLTQASKALCIVEGGSRLQRSRITPNAAVQTAQASLTPTIDSNVTPHQVVQQLEKHRGPISRAPTICSPAPVVVVISGPSGVGKDAVIKKLEEQRPDLYFVVTATSRSMRPGEIDGVDYHFVSKEHFESWIAAGELLEYAVVYGEYKGIPKQEVLNALSGGTDVVLRIDVQGAATVRKLLPDIVSIFLVAESEHELVHRLVSRKTETFDRMVVRVDTARDELSRLSEFDYVVVNKDGQLDETVKQLGMIIDSEKLRVCRRLTGSHIRL